MKLGPNQTKWIEALESGKYEQTQGALRDDGGGFCCLGLAAEVLKKTEWVLEDGVGYALDGYADSDDPDFNYECASKDTVKRLGLYGNLGDKKEGPNAESLAFLNDKSHTFKDIATTLRNNPEDYFKETL